MSIIELIKIHITYLLYAETIFLSQSSLSLFGPVTMFTCFIFQKMPGQHLHYVLHY